MKESSIDIVNALFSLHFVLPKNFNQVCNTILNSIKKDGYFIGTFLGKNDTWNNGKFNMTFIDKEDIYKLFKNFNIIYFEEKEYDKKTALGHDKHWHVYYVLAKKIKNNIF